MNFHLKLRDLVHSERFFVRVLAITMLNFRLNWWFGRRWRCTFRKWWILC